MTMLCCTRAAHSRPAVWIESYSIFNAVGILHATIQIINHPQAYTDTNRHERIHSSSSTTTIVVVVRVRKVKSASVAIQRRRYAATAVAATVAFTSSADTITVGRLRAMIFVCVRICVCVCVCMSAHRGYTIIEHRRRIAMLDHVSHTYGEHTQTYKYLIMIEYYAAEHHTHSTGCMHIFVRTREEKMN